MVGIIGGIVVAAIMKTLVDDGLIPTYFVWLFVLVGIAGNIATINSNRLTGTVYTIGWLIGGLILKDVLEPVDFIIYIVAPIVILVLRVWQFIEVTIKPKVNTASKTISGVLSMDTIGLPWWTRTTLRSNT